MIKAHWAVCDLDEATYTQIVIKRWVEWDFNLGLLLWQYPCDKDPANDSEDTHNGTNVGKGPKT